jgi:pyruvate formate lyase activating enzyme
MKIAAFQKFSMIDYPEKLSAVVFTQGCNFRCPYCHNPELVHPHLFTEPIPEKEVFDLLKKRVGKLDAVTVTGGEPTLHKDLILFLSQVKELGFLAKLDTNGTNPNMLELLLMHRLIDFVAMDVKAPLLRYLELTRTKIDVVPILQSIEMIKKAKIKHEFRTTVVKHLISENEIKEISELLGAKANYVVQNFKPTKTLDTSFMKRESFSQTDLTKLKLLPNLENLTIRN